MNFYWFVGLAAIVANDTNDITIAYSLNCSTSVTESEDHQVVQSLMV